MKGRGRPAPSNPEPDKKPSKKAKFTKRRAPGGEDPESYIPESRRKAWRQRIKELDADDTESG